MKINDYIYTTNDLRYWEWKMERAKTPAELIILLKKWFFKMKKILSGV